MDIKLFDSELKIMDVLWREGDTTAKHIMCHALIPKEEVQEAETNELINKIYDGSADKLFTALLGRKKLSTEQIDNLKKIVGNIDDV